MFFLSQGNTYSTGIDSMCPIKGSAYFRIRTNSTVPLSYQYKWALPLQPSEKIIYSPSWPYRFLGSFPYNCSAVNSWAYGCVSYCKWRHLQIKRLSCRLFQQGWFTSGQGECPAGYARKQENSLFPRWPNKWTPRLCVGMKTGFAITVYDLLGILKSLWDSSVGYFTQNRLFLFQSDAYKCAHHQLSEWN